MHDETRLTAIEITCRVCLAEAGRVCSPTKPLFHPERILDAIAASSTEGEPSPEMMAKLALRAARGVLF